MFFQGLFELLHLLFVKGLVAARNQLKVGIDFRAALAEAANLSGQLAANLGFNPERIAVTDLNQHHHV